MTEKRFYDGRELKYQNMLDTIRVTLSDLYWNEDIPVKIVIDVHGKEYELDDVETKLYCDRIGKQQTILTLKVKEACKD